MGITLGGLGSGLDTNQIITQLMNFERQPLRRIDTQRAQFQARQRAWTEMATQLTTLKGSADALKTPAAASVTKPATSDPTRVAVSGGLSAATGSTTFRVLSLATAHQASSAGFASTASTVGTGTLTATSGLVGLGATAARAGAGLADGNHSLVVTQASSGATVTGTALTVPYTPVAGQNSISATTASGTVTATLDPSVTYTSLAELAEALTTAFGGGAVARADGDHLVVSSLAEGSASSLTLSGSGVGALGLTAASTAGADAVVTLDGTSHTLSDLSGSVDVGGVLTLTTNGLRAGTASVGVVRPTDATTTLAQLASKANDLTGVAASAVDTGSGPSPARLVLTSRSTGEGGALTLSAEGFTGLPDSFTDLRRASDATMVLGDPNGPSPLVIRRSSNTVSDLVPGVTITLGKADRDTDVTVSVNRDTDTMATKYKALITHANALLDSVAKTTKYDVATKSGGALVGDSRARSISSDLYTQFYALPGGALRDAGISTNRSGRFEFDEAAMRTAAETDPARLAQTMSTLSAALSTYAEAAGGTTGTVGSAQASLTSSLTQLQTRQDNAERRLVSVESRYRTQFARLDSAMGVLRSQSDWLAGQIKSLPTYS